MTSVAAKPEAEATAMKQALHRARLAEAAHFDAVIDIRDAQTLRLQVLKDELAPVVSAHKDLGDFISLALGAGRSAKALDRPDRLCCHGTGSADIPACSGHQ